MWMCILLYIDVKLKSCTMHYLESGNEMLPGSGPDAESPDCWSPGRPAPPTRHKMETLEQHLDI